jgi:tetratricopeptide (TPR) repeat protein
LDSNGESQPSLDSNEEFQPSLDSNEEFQPSLDSNLELESTSSSTSSSNLFPFQDPHLLSLLQFNGLPEPEILMTTTDPKILMDFACTMVTYVKATESLAYLPSDFEDLLKILSFANEKFQACYEACKTNPSWKAQINVSRLLFWWGKQHYFSGNALRNLKRPLDSFQQYRTCLLRLNQSVNIDHKQPKAFRLWSKVLILLSKIQEGPSTEVRAATDAFVACFTSSLSKQCKEREEYTLLKDSFVFDLDIQCLLDLAQAESNEIRLSVSLDLLSHVSNLLKGTSFEQPLKDMIKLLSSQENEQMLRAKQTMESETRMMKYYEDQFSPIVEELIQETLAKNNSLRDRNQLLNPNDFRSLLCWASALSKRAKILCNNRMTSSTTASTNNNDNEGNPQDLETDQEIDRLFDQAEKRLKTAADQNPENVTLLYEWALLWMRKGRWAEFHQNIPAAINAYQIACHKFDLASEERNTIQEKVRYLFLSNLNLIDQLKLNPNFFYQQ